MSAARHRNSSVQFQTLRIGYVLRDKHQVPVQLRARSPSVSKGHFRTRFWNPQSLSEEAADGGVSRPAPRVRPHRVVIPSPFQVFLMNPEPATVLGVRWRPDFGALRGVDFVSTGPWVFRNLIIAQRFYSAFLPLNRLIDVAEGFRAN